MKFPLGLAKQTLQFVALSPPYAETLVEPPSCGFPTFSGLYLHLAAG